VRKHGLTVDNLLAAEIVTADGEVLVVDADHDPDLFWALRGGGGNFGVVTRFRYRLAPLGEIVGGMLILPATVDTVAGFIAAAEAAPEELGTIANVMNCPPMPFVPEEFHGQVVIMALMAHGGSVDEGTAAVAPFRALATPIADQLRPIRLPEMYPPEDDSYHPTAVSTTMFIDHVDRGTAATILGQLDASDAPLRAAQLRVLGGAMARVPADATAFAHRSSRIMVNLAAFYEGEADRVHKQAWVDGFAKAIDQGDRAAYVNFINEDGPASVAAAYPPSTLERLARVKARYDPTNLFRRNHNVAPAAS
jgi:FAD/FMN-containing dehydrogenase